jgi:hypothetical protein
VRALVAQRDGARVGGQGGEDLGGQAGGEVEGQGRAGNGRCFGEGEELGEPEGEGEGGTGFEAVRGVVEVAEVGDVEFELAGDFLEIYCENSAESLEEGDIPLRPLGWRQCRSRTW